MRRDSRWVLYGPILMIGALLLAWRFAWSAGADGMRSTLRRAADRLADVGVVMTYAPLETTGFPFALRGVAEDVQFRGVRRHIDVARLRLDVTPPTFDRVEMSTDRLMISGDGAFWTVDGDLSAFVDADAKRRWRLTSKSAGIVAMRGSTAWTAEEALLNVAPLPGKPRTLESTIAVRNVALRDTPARIDSIAANFLLAPEPDADAPNANRAREIAVNAMRVQFLEATITGDGALFVAPGGSVSGVIDACIDRPAALARFARGAGVLQGREADAAEAALALAAMAGNGRLCGPITVRDGRIGIAGVTFAKY